MDDLRPSDTAALDGFASDDLAAAFGCFRLTASAIVAEAEVLRAALPADPALRDVCRAALALPDVVSAQEAFAFFTTHFEPDLATPAEAFFTGYYEPVVAGALQASAAFTAPLLARPSDLRTFAADEPRPAALEGFTAARVGPDGHLSPFADRSAIEAGIAAGLYQPIVWLRDWVEVFLIHVQGSARVRLPDGTLLRVTYAGRNGHPYTSIGRILIERGAIALADMSLATLKAWVRQHGQQPGEEGRTLLQRNASYIFFAAAPAADGGGPTGGAGVPLTAGRSIAVDRSLWSYGLPFWIDAVLPWDGPSAAPFRRLMIAQDTGSAILGAARADLFVGSGDAAGTIAGGIRHRGAMIPLRPRALDKARP